MKILFISRKKASSIGGLARFAKELSANLSEFVNLSFNPFSKPDLIYLCDATLLPIGVALKTILNIPLVVTAHGLDLTYPKKWYQILLKWFLPKVDLVIVDSQAAKPLLTPFKYPPHKIHLINPGITIDHLNKLKPVELPNLKDKIVLLTVGNLVERKGHLWFIKNALSKLSNDFIYLIVGDGPERKNLESRVKSLELEKRVFLMGKLTDPQLAYVFKKTDIYVCPNQKIQGNFEGFGLAVGEAAALGLPVVASKVDGISEIIKDNQNGYLVKPTPQAFIHTLNKLKNPKLRQVLGQKAKVYTQKSYSWEKTAKQYLRVFQALIDKN